MRDRMATNFSPLYGQGGTISYTGSAVNSATPAAGFGPGIAGVFVTCTTDAWAKLGAIVNGTGPTATTADFFCPANATVWIPNDSQTNENMQLSVVRDSSSGSARYTPGA